MTYSDPFFAELRPYAAALADVQATARASRPADYLPASSSIAERELEQQSSFSTEWRNEPILSAYSMGHLLIAAADDHLTSLLKLAAGDPVPLYGSALVARALIESSGRAIWIFDNSITPVQRIERGWTETLYSWHHMKRLPSPASVDIESRTLAIKNSCDALDLRFVTSDGNRPPYVNEPRLGATASAELALGAELGRFSYNYLSAVSHGTSFGVMQSVQRDTHNEGLYALGISTKEIVYLWSLVALAFVNGLDAEFRLFGWDNETWDKAKHRALGLFNNLYSDVAP